MRTIAAKDAGEWAAWLKTSEELAENTIRKRSQFAKRFFSVAAKRKLIREVLPFLQAAWEAAPEGAFWIFPSIRSGRKNLRTWLERAILKAGLRPWPRLWQNFRATRATELADKYPPHVAAAWLGHTERIADGHYRQVTAEHYERARSEATGAIPTWTDHAEKVGPFLAHSPHVSVVSGSVKNQESPEKSEDCGALSMIEKHQSGGHGTRTRNPITGAPHFQCGR